MNKKLAYVCIIVAFAFSCGKSDRSEVYNENNTTAINGVVYNTNEQPINGLYKTYYDDGNVKMEIESLNGLPHGQGKFYDKDGKLQYLTLFFKGRLNGSLYHYYPDGSVHNEMNFVNGIKNGVQKSYNEEGDIVAEIVYEEGKAISGVVYSGEEKKELTSEELSAM